jgi:DNA-binding transcriptional LysR family regulator
LNKWHRRPIETINSESFDLIARLTDAGIGYGIIPERAVELIGLKLKKHKDLPSFKDSICLVYRPEFGKKPYEKELIASVTKAVQ